LKKRYKALKLRLLALYPICEVCGISRASQINHVLYHKHGGIFDSIENCRSCCPNCNTGYGQNANSREAKKKHWLRRCKELGSDHMNEWNSKVSKWRREWFGE